MKGLIRRPVRAVLERAGRNGDVDPELTTRDLVALVSTRVAELARGLLLFQGIIFRGRRVRVRGRTRLALGKYSAVGDYSSLDCVSRGGITLAEGAKLGRFVTVTGTSSVARIGEGLRLGRNSAIGDFGHVGCAGGVLIGNDVIVGPYATFHSQTHVAKDLDVPIRMQGTEESAITIGDDVWVGARVSFLSGASIGAHSIVAAGAVVRGEFPPYSIVGGVPARLLRTRSSTADANSRVDADEIRVSRE